MKVESCFQLGYVTRSHGIQGEVLIYIDSDDPERYNSLESVFVDVNQQLVPFFVEFIQIQQQHAILKFEGISNRESSESLKGSGLYLPLEFLPVLEDGQFYYHDVIGYRIIDEMTGTIGEIESVYEANGNDLFSVMYRGKEVLIPIRDEIITRIDNSGRKIFVKLPEGLIDIYLNP